MPPPVREVHPHGDRVRGRAAGELPRARRRGRGHALRWLHLGLRDRQRGQRDRVHGPGGGGARTHHPLLQPNFKRNLERETALQES